ncbi:MAG: NUDIX hydrolase [Ruthenibacterium sp.]
MIHYEKQLSSETKFTGNVITVTLDTVELENGKTSLREVVHHHGGAAVVALNDKDEVYLVRQYRYALAQELIEIPAGKLEKGEDPFEAAKRELGEEAGLTAATYLDLGYIIPTCGYCSERIYLYAAKNLSQVKQNLDADEFLSVFTMPLDEAVARVLSGEITDGKTVAALLKVKALHDGGKF